MKKFIVFSVSLLSILTISMLQSCSTSEENNLLQESQSVTITQNNLDKKWLTTFYGFTNAISQASKTAYQVSSVEIHLNNGKYNIYDRYSEKKDKGTYLLDKNTLTLTSTETGETILFKIEKLTQTEVFISVINHKDLTAVELIAIR
ncbi:hypothetical protein LNQ81_11905 [Myroides sp. M-43]|uniref:hypothetical protein n=1 Tax=Myroides oncorhynchi TaxID=2893756 RepID=UPI001E501DD2|nr:hypothetical protein [Myroides oncorhynchi]MCC9043373.1 hypothetical protein [Myroides oncorhynchi]